MPVEVQKHLFTVREFHQMAEGGIFAEDDRVELLAGEIFELTPIGSRHAGCVNALTNTLAAQLGSAVIVSVQNPVVLDDFSEPQPDLLILRPRADFYRDGHPTPDDVRIVIEVADSLGLRPPREAASIRAGRHSGSVADRAERRRRRRVQ